MIRTRGKAAAPGAPVTKPAVKAPASQPPVEKIAPSGPTGGAPQEGPDDDNPAGDVPVDAPDKHETLALAEKNQHKLPPRRIPRG